MNKIDLQQTFERIVNYRRAVRKFQQDPIPLDIIKRCISSAILAPSSSNLQLWEYYHVTDPDKKAGLVKACMSQPAAATAPNLIVVVTRHDLWRQRCAANLEFIKSLHQKEPDEKPIKAETYFKKTIPALYTDIFGILGCLKKAGAFFIGLTRPMYREVTAHEVRAMSHKSVALSAQTFMLAMASEGYDTCPMEGIDSKRVKRLLGLPSGAYINMVIACGKRAEGGIYAPRFRLPLDEIFYTV